MTASLSMASAPWPRALQNTAWTAGSLRPCAARTRTGSPCCTRRRRPRRRPPVQVRAHHRRRPRGRASGVGPRVLRRVEPRRASAPRAGRLRRQLPVRCSASSPCQTSLAPSHRPCPTRSGRGRNPGICTPARAGGSLARALEPPTGSRSRGRRRARDPARPRSGSTRSSLEASVSVASAAWAARPDRKSVV